MLSELYKIQKLLEEAQNIFNSLPTKQQDYINSLHNENAQLAYCLRWGEMAASEALEDLDQSLIEGKTLKVGKNQIYYDKMCSVLDGFETLEEAFKAARCPSVYKRERSKSN